MRRLILFLCILISIQAPAQQRRYHHGVFWFRLAIADTVGKQFRWELLLQKRTQDAGPEDKNIFTAPQFKSAWLWLNYTLSPKVKVAVSPFGYFESYVLNTKPADVNLKPIREFRWSARLEHETKGRFFNFSNRYNLEYRWRDLQNNDRYLPNWRVRFMAKIEKPLFLLNKRPLTFTVYDEVFLQFGRAVKDNPNVFDQNRVYVGASYELVRNVKFNLGYIYGFQARNSGEEFDNINTIWTVLTFDNFISQFLRRKRSY